MQPLARFFLREVGGCRTVPAVVLRARMHSPRGAREGTIGAVHPSRILIYSHDSFGLGHLRRCRAIASSLARGHRGLSVLIVSGSPLIGSFEFPSRVDFVRVPGVIKLRNGDYSSLSLRLDLGEVLALRESIIRHTADAFQPDLLIVDKEPLGLRGEMADTLEMLKRRGTCIALGLRDVLDDPVLLADELERKQALPALAEYYDRIWVYGLESVCDPLADLALPPGVREKMAYTGYLRRDAPEEPPSEVVESLGFDLEEPHILVTGGGGGDGEELFDQVLAAYEHDPGLPWPAVLLFGPFMPAPVRDALRARAADIPQVRATLVFEPRVEALIERAAAIVGMGGYNTFCEILSFDRPALLVPRRRPRMEQLIRAARAHELGLVRMFDPDLPEPAARMAAELRALPDGPRPSDAYIPGLLDGLPNIGALVRDALAHGPEEEEASPVPAPVAATEAPDTPAPAVAAAASGPRGLP